ncbi:hypothetical protein CDL15_Pgr008145 [Punica granatum]|nr:hypothetical protein CDL15_Pgr008145 [Punica granatum]
MGRNTTSMAPLLLRSLFTSLFLFAEKPFINLSERYKILDLLHTFIVSSFLFFLRLLSAVVPLVDLFSSGGHRFPFVPKGKKPDFLLQLPGGVGDYAIARALSQLLAIVNTLPVSSRKYEAARSLAERLIDENQQEGTEALREVNRKVLSAAFSRTLTQLEAAMVDGGPARSGVVPAEYFYLNRGLRVVKSLGHVVWSLAGTPRDELVQEGSSAEKLAAELVWLAQKLAACGCAEEAVCLWALASKLSWLSVSGEPRLQGLLVKVSAFLFKQAKDMRVDPANGTEKEQQRQTKMKMLMSWLPLLCRASNGTDAPVLSLGERAELERVLEETIEMLDQEEEQEQVLSQWLHHFMYCPSSDWPNLHSSYTRWCTASRKLLPLPVNAN